MSSHHSALLNNFIEGTTSALEATGELSYVNIKQELTEESPSGSDGEELDVEYPIESVYVKGEPPDELQSRQQESDTEADTIQSEPILNEPTMKKEPGTIQSRGEIDKDAWVIKTEEVDVSDYVRDKPSDAEDVSRVADVPSPGNRFVSARDDRGERHRLPSTADTSDCAPFIANFPAENRRVKRIVMANRKHLNKSSAPSKVKSAESDKCVASVSSAEAEKQSAAESPRLTAQSFACDLCRALFPTKARLTEHVTRFCFKNLFLRSMAAESQFAGGGERNRDSKTIDVRKYACTFCPKLFSHSGNRNSHLRMHTGEKKYACKFCPKLFTGSSSINRHLRTHTGEKRYACKFCAKLFSQSGNRNSHMLTHTGERRYACKFCPKLFTESSSRNRHLLTHTGEKNYACKFCPMLFSAISSRNRHLLTHTGEKKYSCKFCPLLFSQTSNRNKHVLTHTRENKFTCKFCPMLFSRTSNRNAHLLTHTEEKKYSCKYCPKLFTQTSNRNKHLITHTGEKKFECKFCPMLFSQSGNRNRHVLTHTGEKKFACQFCPKLFTGNSNRNKHLLTHTTI